MLSDFKSKEKAALIIDLSGSQGASVIQNLIKLLDLLISEVRIDNDTAGYDNVLINQGEIRAYLRLKEYIERGLPTINR